MKKGAQKTTTKATNASNRAQPEIHCGLAQPTHHLVTFGDLTFTVVVNSKGFYSGSSDHGTIQPQQLETPHLGLLNSIRPPSSRTYNITAQKPQKQTNPNPSKTTIPFAGKANTAIHSVRPATQGQKEGRYRYKYAADKETKNQQKFLKAPPATTQWQKVVRKNNESTKKKRKCFFCQKTGHIRRYCWQRIQCHNCGRQGHKSAKCLYKATESQPNQQPTAPRSYSIRAMISKKGPNLHSQREITSDPSTLWTSKSPSPATMPRQTSIPARANFLSCHPNSTICTPIRPALLPASVPPHNLEGTPPIWLPKHSQPLRLLQARGGSSPITPVAPAPLSTPPLYIQFSPHDFSLNIATVDPTPFSDTQHIHYLTRIHSLHIPRPIEFASLFGFLSAAPRARTHRQPRSYSQATALDLCLPSPSSPRMDQTINKLALIVTAKDFTLEKGKDCLPLSVCLLGPSRPTSVSTNRPTLILTETQILPRSLLSPQDGKLIQCSPSLTSPSILREEAHQPEPETEMDLYPISTADDHDLHPTQQDAQQKKETSDSLYQSAQQVATLCLAAGTAPTAPRTTHKAKGKQIATRRSERIRAKEQIECATLKPVKSAKAKMTNIQFQMQSHYTPLQVDSALSILQESGLEINQKVQDMIHEATKIDLVNTAQDDDAPPRTPLHDHIPPLMLPGEAMAL